MKSLAVVLVLCFSLLWAEEPSAFELQSGATKKEIKDIKDSVESNSNKIFELETRLKNLDTSIEGLKSIYEGQASSINEINNKITNTDSSDASKDDLSALQEQVSNNAKNIQTLTESLKNITSSIEQIQNILNEINQNESVQKQEPQKPENKEPQNQEPQKSADKEPQNSNEPETPEKSADDFDKDTTRRGDIFKEARSLTYAKKFNEAIARYNWFIEIDYKKAESNYMLGNIAYEQNRYTDAIAYYKESAILDDKASYIPRLLLNSANSFRVLNDKENARTFYQTLISSFPNSNEAKEGKKQLDKLN